MWGQVRAGNGFHVMAYDVPSRMAHDRGENSFFVSLRGETVEEVTGYWAKLCYGATVVIPMAPAGWAPAYGMVRDRFGVVWVVDVASGHNG
jgi:PhnB protein